MVSASSRARSVVFMKAPVPTFTSSTSEPVPSAIFLLMIDEAISGIASTVPVDVPKGVGASWSARRQSVAGRADQPRRPTRAARTSLRWRGRPAKPGIDSSLSRVPPVWPSPRPDGWGYVATPHAATSGASGSADLVAHPTGGVLVGRRLGTAPGEVHPLPRRDHRRGPAHDLVAVHAVEQDRHRQCRHLLVRHHPMGVGVHDPVDLLGRQPPTVPLGDDHVDCVHG